MKTEDRAKMINDILKIWCDNIRNHEDWNEYNRRLAYQFERLGMYPTVFIPNNNEGLISYHTPSSRSRIRNPVSRPQSNPPKGH